MFFCFRLGFRKSDLNVFWLVWCFTGSVCRLLDCATLCRAWVKAEIRRDFMWKQSGVRGKSDYFSCPRLECLLAHTAFNKNHLPNSPFSLTSASVCSKGKIWCYNTILCYIAEFTTITNTRALISQKCKADILPPALSTWRAPNQIILWLSHWFLPKSFTSASPGLLLVETPLLGA